MPYKNVSELPDAVKKLPKKSQDIWLNVFNSAYSKAIADGKDPKEAESSAFAQAWGVLKKQESIFTQFIQKASEALAQLARSIKKVDQWDGAASRFPSTEAYCNACLINVNEGDPKDWKQSNCMLPVREPGDGKDVYVDKAIHAAAGGHGITQVKKPADVQESKWQSALKAAANKIKSAYAAMKQECPEAVVAMTRTVAERAQSTFDVLKSLTEQAQAKNEYAWVTDLYHEDGGMFVIIANQGKLYRADVTFTDDKPVLSETWNQVEIAFEPVAEPEGVESEGELGPVAEYPEDGWEGFEDLQIALSKPRTIIRTLPDGSVRWFSVSCSAVLNRVGEIDSRALFDSFAEHAEQTGEYPIRMFYHSGKEFRTGQCDFVGRDGYLLITSGLFDNTELAKREIAARLQEPEYWGESIGFEVTDISLLQLSDGVSIPVNNRGRLVEISTCPENEAAAWFTATTQNQEMEVMRMMQGKQFEAFKKLFASDPDPEAAAKAWLAENAESRNRAVEDANMVTRAVEDTQPVVPVTEQTQEQPAEQPAEQPVAEIASEDEKQESPTLMLDDEALAVMAGKVAEQIGQALKTQVDTAIASLTARLEAAEAMVTQSIETSKATATQLDTRLAAIEADEEKKREIWAADAPKTVNVSYRPRADVEQVRAKTSEDVAKETLSKFPIHY